MRKFNFLKRLSVLVVMLAVGSVAAMAINSDYYSKVNVNSTGKGTVYVSYKTSPTEYNYGDNASAESGKDRQSNAPTHTYYLYAQPSKDFCLEGWYIDEECTKRHTSIDVIRVEAATDVKNATVNLWAKFVAFSSATQEDPLNVTSLIVNPGFEASTWNTGWTVTGSFEKQNNNGNFTGTFAQVWDKDANKVLSGSIEQTLSNIPAGTYELSAKAVCGVDGKDYLYAKVVDEVKETVLPVTNVGTAREYTVLFTVEEGQSVTIGFARENSKNWSAVDDFSLIYYGKEAQMEEAVLSVKSGKYGTFVAPFDVELPAEVTTYKVFVKGENAYLGEYKKGGETLPAGNPVIVYATDAISKTYVGAPSKDATIEKNGLVGFYQDGQTVPTGAFVLQTKNNEQGFYKVGSTVVNGKKNRCYLPAPATGNVKQFSIVMEEAEETAITSTTANATMVEFHSLNGTKLAVPQRGVNIVKMSNGSVKKVLVK